MHAKLTVSMLVAGSLLGAPVIAFAQTEPAAKPRVTHHTMKPTHMRTGTTNEPQRIELRSGQGPARRFVSF
jgi:hypothetical protein